jgi:hypothetical protein
MGQAEFPFLLAETPLDRSATKSHLHQLPHPPVGTGIDEEAPPSSMERMVAQQNLMLELALTARAQ